MKVAKLDSVGGNKFCRNTAPIAATNNGYFIHDDNVVCDFRRKGWEKKKEAERKTKDGTNSRENA